jgi:hypothetical protein
MQVDVTGVFFFSGAGDDDDGRPGGFMRIG